MELFHEMESQADEFIVERMRCQATSRCAMWRCRAITARRTSKSTKP